MDRRQVTEAVRHAARLLLGAFLIAAGVAHLLIADEFYAQVPSWMPLPAAVVAVSGVIEIVLGAATLLARKHRQFVGGVVAAWFIVIVVGNVYQATAGIDAFGLRSDTARWVRVGAQPLLVAWAWWATRRRSRPSQQR